MKKLSILHVSPAPPQLGGMEAYMGSLLNSSLMDVHHVRLLNISKPRLFKGGVYDIKTGYAGAFKRRLSITLTSYGYSLTFFLKYLAALIFRQIDVVHIHTASYTSFWEKSMYILGGKLFRRKIVLHVHGALFRQFYEKSSPLSKRLIRYFLNKCDAVIALSESWRAFLSNLIPAPKIHVVKNGINVQPFDDCVGDADKTVFLHIGEVSRRKGIFDVIEAAGRLKQKGLDFQFKIAGPGEIEEARLAAKNAGLSDVVAFHGPTRGDDKVDLFKKANCFILASYGEGLPIAILEALAAGLPVITTPVGGIPEVIKEEENGYLVEPGNVDQIYSAMKKIIRESEARKRISAVNFSYARKEYNIERCAEKISQIYYAVTT